MVDPRVDYLALIDVAQIYIHHHSTLVIMNEEEHSFASDIDDSNGDEVGFITYL